MIAGRIFRSATGRPLEPEANPETPAKINGNGGE